MRLRNIPGSRERIAQSPYVIPEASLPEHRGAWREVFGSDRPIRLEIGMGKGRFLIDMARQNPDVSFLGIEKYSSVLIRALDKREECSDLDNLYFLRMDAADLTEVFAPGEISMIYLNFSDPWPKERHAGRRLPGPLFLDRYRQILPPDGQVRFKTDNTGLFAFAVESARSRNWQILSCTEDLHHDPQLCEGNVMTEYEERFSAAGHPICQLVLSPPLAAG